MYEREDPMTDTMTAFGQEWTTLQNNYERYESGALMVKLVAVVLFFAGFALEMGTWLVCLVMLVLWLQEGIFKTYQARLGERLLELEQLCGADAADGPGGKAFQLHTAWLARRKGMSGLLTEYALSACRPTVAFPYLVLILWVLTMGLPLIV
jgi:hypothetical protein